MLAARNDERIDRSLARDGRAACALELGIKESNIERGIVDHERRTAKKGDEVVHHLREKELVFEEFIVEAMDRERLRRHGALGIEIAVERLPGWYAVDQLDAADLDQAMAV